MLLKDLEINDDTQIDAKSRKANRIMIVFMIGNLIVINYVDSFSHHGHLVFLHGDFSRTLRKSLLLIRNILQFSIR